MNKFRKGMVFKNKNTGQMLVLINKKNDSFWQASTVTGGKRKSHRVGEGTLKRFYEEIN